MRRLTPTAVLVAAVVVTAVGAPALAQWNQNASTGPFLYTDTANWVGGTINNTFSSDPTTGLVVNWDADYTMGGALNLSYSGNQDIAFQSDSGTTRTIKMAGDWTRGGGGTVTVGTLANPLTLDLDGTTRTFGGSSANYAINAAIVNTGSTAAGITLNAGSVTLSASNSFTGGTTLSSGSLVVGHTNALGASAGAVTVNGGTLDLGGLTSTRTGTVTLAGGLVQNGTLASNSIAFDVRSGTVAAVLGGSAGLSKTTSGTFTITGAATYAGSTTISAGRLNLSGGNNRLPTATSLTISGGTLDVGSTSQSITNFTASAGTIQGSGTLSVTAATGGVQNVTMTNLARFSYDAGTATVNFGAQAGNQNGSIYLSATSNYIRAGTIQLPFQNTSGSVTANGTLYFGGSNTVHANNVNVGWGVRDFGTAQFATGLTNPTLTIRAQNGTGRAAINVGWPRNSGYTSGGTFDTGAGFLDALVTTLTVGLGGNSTGFGLGQGTFTMGTGTLDATTIYVGQSVNSASGDGTMQVSGGTVIVDTLHIGFRSSTGASTGKFTLQTNGVLQATTITPGSGASTTFTWNSGTIGNKSGGNLTINSGFSTFNLATSGSHVFSIDSGRTGSVATNMSGVGRLTKAGTGLLTLTGSNSYSGGTTLVDGTLRLGHASALGSTSGTLAVDGGTLDLFGQSLTVGALSGSSGGTITTATAGAVTLTVNLSGTTAYAGTIANGSGTVGLTKSGAGTLTLSAANTYTGATTVSAGTLAFGIDNAISGSSAITIGSGGSRGSLAIGAYDLTTASLTFTGLGGNLPTGSGGEISLQSATGTATISAVSGSSTLHPKLTLSSDAVFDVTSGATLALHADVFGGGSLTKSGSGTMTMHGASSYAGGTYLTQGGITVAGANSLVFGSGTVTLGDDTVLDLGGAAIDNVIVFASGTATSAVILNSGSFVSLSGAGSLTSGTAATISASYKLLDGADITFQSPFSGSALVQSGGGGLFSDTVSGLVQVSAGGTARIDGDVTGDVVSSGSTAIYGAVYDNVAVNGGTTSILGTTAVGSLISTGTGGVAARTLLSGTVNGGAHVGSLGIAELSNLVTGEITSDAGGTVILRDGYSTTASSMNINGSLVIDRTTPLTVGATIGGSGAVELLGGLLTLSATNTHSGGTIVSGGTIQAGSGGALGPGALALNAGGLDLNGQTVTIGALSGSSAGSVSSAVGGPARLVTNVTADSTFAGVVSDGSGVVSLQKTGAGTLTLTSAQIYTGATIIAGGTLALSNAGSLAQSSYLKAGAVANDFGVLDVTALGSGLTIASGQRLGGYGTVLGDVMIATGGTVAPGGSIGSLTNSGTQTWAGGGTYLFEVTNAYGDGSYAGTRWDLLTVNSLMITSTASPFTIALQTLTNPDDETAGAMSPGNWDPDTSYQWKFLVATSTTFSGANFNPAWFSIDQGNFLNTPLNGTFSVAYGGTGPGGLGGATLSNELYVVYAAVPEPGTLALAGVGLAMAGWHAGRRRRGVGRRG